MNSSDYVLRNLGRYSLRKRIGAMEYCLVYDNNYDIINGIYQNILNNIYPSERELFEDIYNHYKGRSILCSS